MKHLLTYLPRRFRAWQRRNRRRSQQIAVVIAAWGGLCLIGDVLAKRPPAELQDPDPRVAEAVMLAGGMNGLLDYTAVHTWLCVHLKGEERWERWEITGGDWYVKSDDLVRRDAFPTPLEWPHGAGPSQVLKLWRGAEAERLAAVLRERSYENSTDYYAWPGPNSNTYVDRMLRRARVSATFPSTAVGKDYRGWIGASTTSTGTGVQLESPLIGVKLGVVEGFEFHLLAGTFGIDLWPPALKVPYGDGRFGFAE